MILVKRILVVQRNNIGDMVLATPLLAGLRREFPGAKIDVLATSYNATVLDGFAAVDHVHVYTKLKHRGPHQSWLGNVLEQLALRRRLRKVAYDTIILNSGPTDRTALALARAIANPHCRIIRFADDPANGIHAQTEVVLPYPSQDGTHQVEKTALLGAALERDPNAFTGQCEVHADPARLRLFVAELAHHRQMSVHPLRLRESVAVVALSLSARRIDQRWPASHVIEFAKALHAALHCQIVLLWSPGSQTNRLHPGDDEKAAEVEAALRTARVPVFAPRTATLPDLIAALACCDIAVLPDGGAMHLAAGVGKPVVALFGSAQPSQWHPWDVSHRVLHPESRNVQDIPPSAALAATLELLAQAPLGASTILTLTRKT